MNANTRPPYLLYRLSTIHAMFLVRPDVPLDAYLSEDAETLAIKQAINDGYRWTRDSGDLAVFELQV